MPLIASLMTVYRITRYEAPFPKGVAAALIAEQENWSEIAISTPFSPKNSGAITIISGHTSELNRNLIYQLVYDL